MLTPETPRGAQRQLAAARAKRDAGALDAALGLLIMVEAGPLDALSAAQVEQLRGQIAFDQRRAGDAARLLLSAARHLEPLDPDLARETHPEALGARCGPPTSTVTTVCDKPPKPPARRRPAPSRRGW